MPKTKVEDSKEQQNRLLVGKTLEIKEQKACQREQGLSR